jgi:catechol 2,3-dioxygenase-like lactoylglutathione lyase family enzyme
VIRKWMVALGLAAVFVLLSAGNSHAQIAPPNEAGVSMGHMHLVVQDVDATKDFLIKFGGTATKRPDGVKFPGVMFLIRKGEPAGGTVGSVVGHFGFNVPNTTEALAKWNALGLRTEVGQNPGQGFVYTPDNLTRIEILEVKTLDAPLKFHHVHFYVADPGPAGGSAVLEMQAWYAKVFGAKPGKRGQFDAADLPGVNLTFTKSDTPTVPTKGRMLDHIGFEIPDLEGFCKRETALGVKFDSSCSKDPSKPVFTIFLTDPWGTNIELTNTMSTF